jgi:hypothetical protein
MSSYRRFGVLAALCVAGCAAFASSAWAAKTVVLRYGGDHPLAVGAETLVQDTGGMAMRGAWGNEAQFTRECAHFESQTRNPEAPLALGGELETNEAKVDKLDNTGNTQLRGCGFLFAASSEFLTLSNNQHAALQILFAFDTYPECNFDGVMRGSWTSTPDLVLTFKEQTLRLTEKERAKFCGRTLRLTITFNDVDYVAGSTHYPMEAVID